MPRVPLRPLRVVLTEARRALSMSQREFGYAVGSSHRSAARWDAGAATPGVHNLHVLAKLLLPVDRSLAVEAAAHGGETLVDLGLEAAIVPQDLTVDAVLLAAVEHSGAAPAVARTWLHAVFKRALEVGMTTEAAERAFRPAPARATKAGVPDK
jgi:transcriptional regulator with XRE-family HTH domain